MRRGVDLLNGLAIALVLTLASVGVSWGLEATASLVSRAPTHATVQRERLPDGRPALRDAQGVLVPLIAYRRIASATLSLDRALADLCEPERIVAFSRAAQGTPDAHRYQGKPALGPRDGIEPIVALAPDLLLVSELFDASYAARLREHGVAVFDVGAMRGMETLLPSLHALGALIGAPERAARYAERLAARMQRIAPPSPRSLRPRALYIGVYGARLFGGAAHTSYHDVLEAAGLYDVTVELGLQGWPELTAEHLLRLAPEVLVTRTGMAPLVCRYPGLEAMRPCRSGRILELESGLLDDPGPGMLEAAEALHAALLDPE